MKNVSLFFVIVLFLEGVSGQTVSVKEGKPAVIRSGLSEIKTDDVMDWRFGAGILIARVRKQNPTVYEDALDGAFKGRLTLDGKTGDLTISNTKTTDSGDYEISNSINTYNKKVTLSVDSGLSPGAIAGIVVTVVVAVLVGAALGIYYGILKKRDMV